MFDALGKVNYLWDGEHLRGVTRADGSGVTYERDSQGNLSGIKVDDHRIRYTRDFLGRLQRIQTPVGEITFRYLPGQGILERTLPNGVETRWTRGPDGRLTQIVHANKACQVLAQFTYLYRPDGRVAAVEEWSPQGRRTLRYDFDEMGQLIAVDDSRTGGRIDLTFDLVGNRIEYRASDASPVFSVCDPLGRLMRHGGQPCEQDAAGNLTRYETATGWRRFEFDAANLIKSAALGNARADYGYDGDGALVTRVCGGDTTRFVNDPLASIWRPLLATDRAGRTTLYIWNGDLVVGALSGNQARFFLEDHLGSVRLVTDGPGAFVERCDYDAHGLPLRTLNDETLRPGFAGMFFDPAARLYLARARCYEPELGRFLQVEPCRRLPLGSIKDISLFAYCGNDSVNLVDRDGCEPRRPEALIRDTQLLQDINQVYAVFDDALVLGLGSGVRPHADILKDAQGRFQVIDITASGARGGAFDLYEYAITGGRDWDGQVRRANWTSRNPAVDHSAGNHIDIPGGIPPIRVDPSAQRALEHNQIERQGIVSDLTVGELCFGQDYVGIGFRAKFDNNPLDAVGELARDVGSLGRGLVTFGARVAEGKSPFWSHDFKLFRDELAQQNKIKPEGTYREVQIVTREGTYFCRQDPGNGTWTLQRIGSHPTTPNSAPSLQGANLNTSSHSAGGPLPPGGGANGGFPGGTSKLGGGSHSAMMPANVGGVWLGGAGDVLGNLGPLKGIALGEDGRLILLGTGRADIALPPLRLSDLVTVFRSVYEQGEAPFVSIDPDPQNPRGPTMLIRHGNLPSGQNPGWAQWILYESDRVMKSYSLTRDSLTGELIQSKVAGYTALADKIAHGEGTRGEDSVWERYWIVPSVTRRPSTSGEMTLVDVPLEVKTQRMVMRNGKLVPAPDDTPSERATAFAKWFTKCYDEIALESASLPPWLKANGTNHLVPALAELRHIALLAAIAERLRDQHVPMPSWMKEYPVEAVCFGPTTPALTVEWTNATARATSTRRLYGGVSLSPSDDRVRTLSPTREADELLAATREAVVAAPLLTPVSVVSRGQHLQAVALPGDCTRAVGACRWREVDLAVSLRGGDSLRLEREAHSFFLPRDVFGVGWTMDLPRLEQVRRPIRRQGDLVTLRTAFQLHSPLNTWSATFEEEREMPEFGGKLLAASQPGEVIALGRTTDARLGGPTDTVFCRDGARLHFGENGDLAAIEKAGALTKYLRDGQGRLERIEAWRGPQRLANIQLIYEARGRLMCARGSDGSQVSYRYDAEDRLKEAQQSKATMSYSYTNNLLARIERDGLMVREFTFDSRGCLKHEKRGDGSERSFVIAATPSGMKIAAHVPGESGNVEEAEFDSALRPVRRNLSDGTTVNWVYGEGHAATATIRQADGAEHKLSLSTDGRSATWQTATGQAASATFDRNGRLTSLKDGDRSVLRQHWSGDGRLLARMTESTGVHPEYGEDGSVSRVLLTPPVDGPKFQEWMECCLDTAGRVSKISDCTGNNVQLRRDADGGVTRVSSPRGEVRCQRDKPGTTEIIETSWGWKETRSSDRNGRFFRVETRSGQDQATLEHEEGTFTRLVGFDGRRTTFTYSQKGNGASVVEQIEAPNTLTVRCLYDAQSRPVSIRCGSAWKVDFTYDHKGRIVATKYQPLG
jgi:RHS repeat-associated protein